MRILVTGIRGQVACALAEEGAASGHEIVRLGRPDLDLAAPANLDILLAASRPDVIVHAAAYTAVDRAESEPDLAMAINGTAAGLLAAAAARLDLPLIHLSTDYVFDGTKAAPYLETDSTGPLGAYGRSKLAGEVAVAAANPRHVILRTAWVYAREGANFVLTMRRLARERPELRVVGDQLGCPTYATDLARVILAMAGRLPESPAGSDVFGIFHAAGSGETSWAGFARAILAHEAAKGVPPPPVVAIPSAEYPTPARRPANSRLDCSKLNRIYGIRLPDWEEGLSRCLARLDQAGSATGHSDIP
ncbi:MAG: dTDP-4-dehydrorhamnose reductase [Beijerinckiaceae bacterium]|nr:dTDP-4-dehydrorhamnose reductase [Beijerinckiaceae bacterium]MCZ8298777.1 dTDP-4-dehydrorhamnose reductase [Beijerinckiaceae bacterium]